MEPSADAVALKLLQEAQEKLEQYQKRIENLETCAKITSLLTAENNLDVLLDKIMSTAKKVMSADACSLLLVDPETGDLVFQVALSEVGQKVIDAGRVKMGHGIAGTVAKTGQPIAIKDAYNHPKFDPAYDKKTGFSTGSIVCAPLRHQGHIVGVCQVILDRTKGKTFTNDDLPLFQMVCDASALAIQNAITVKNLLKTQQLETDLSIALSVQQGFLPKSPPEHENFLFRAKTVPAKSVGGDYYDFIQLDDKRMGIVVGDVSGRGISAALHMARLMSDFRYVSQLEEPHKVLKEVNNLMCDRTSNGVYTTAIYILLDLKKKRMTVANGGHPSPIMHLQGKLILGEGKASGAPLGIMPNIQYKEEKFSLETGDRIFLFTDGVTETKNPDNVAFGMDRLYDIVLKNLRKPDSVLRELENSLESYRCGKDQYDDWTFLGFQTL